MIYTVTLNPSLDYIVFVDNFDKGQINRTSKELIFPGGKGINVSLVLSNLGMKSKALGFCAGFTGENIIKLLKEKQIESDFISVSKGFSRINVKVKSVEETEINGSGPEISNEESDQFYGLLNCLNDGDYLVLAGSIPSSLPKTIYRDIISQLKNKHINVVVDTTKDQLLDSLEYHPFLIKPNHLELGEIFNTTITSTEEVINYGKKLIEMGAQNVLVSMASKGAVLITSDGLIISSDAPKGNVVNSVGAGDSMVAGFLYEFIKTGNYNKAFYTGLCAGSASAFSDELSTKEEIENLLIQFSDRISL